jgi:hypothetical protein
MKQPVLVSAVLLLVAGCATPLPQTSPSGMPAQVPAPTLEVGNHWRYAVRDAFTNLPRGTVEYRVSAVQGDTATVTVSANGRESTELYTRDGNWLSRPATNLPLFNYSPAYRAFDFPLTPGKKWSARATATDPADGRRFPVLIHGEVLGWERIRVPAGEFDALKVHRVVHLGYWVYNVRGRSLITETEWYAPGLRQAAKREMASRYENFLVDGGRPGLVRVRGGRDDGPRMVRDEWLIYELVSHTAR